MNQTSKNAKKNTDFGPNFDPFGPNYVPATLPPPPTFFFVSYTSTCSWTLFQTIILYN